MKKQVNWYGLDKLPLYLNLSQEQLSSALEQLQNLEICQDRPHVLDSYTIDRIIKLHTEQNENLWVFIEQCSKWCKQNPNQIQLEKITTIEDCTKKLKKIIQQILFLANHYQVNTIDKIFAKEDEELALSFLFGKPF